jgi:small conductance mechanosensitive channel
MITLPENIINTLGTSAVIVLMALFTKLLSNALVKGVVRRVEDDNEDEDTALEKRAYTLSGIIKNLFNVVIFSAMAITLLAEWGINITPILTGAGIMGLAVGFGAQSLVKDVVTGFFILLENQFNIGDKVSIGDKEGVVKEMKLRTTILKDKNGTVYYVPNSQIKIVTKHKKV